MHASRRSAGRCIPCRAESLPGEVFEVVRSMIGSCLRRWLPAMASCLVFLAFSPKAISSAGPSSPVSFRHDVEPILTRAGCNAGACHGTPSGKNGFRLSLRGYDPALDILTLTHEVHSRRLELLEPAAS